MAQHLGPNIFLMSLEDQSFVKKAERQEAFWEVEKTNLSSCELHKKRMLKVSLEIAARI